MSESQHGDDGQHREVEDERSLSVHAATGPVPEMLSVSAASY